MRGQSKTEKDRQMKKYVRDGEYSRETEYEGEESKARQWKIKKSISWDWKREINERESYETGI